MKKLIILLLPVILLTGCTSPAAVSIVENMYTEALMENDEGVAAYFNPAYLEENSIELISSEIAEQARHAEGIKLLNAKQVTRNLLNEEIAEELDETYSDDWFYIALTADEDHIMTWIVLRTSTHYEIVDGEKMTVDAYNDDVLR